MINTDKTEKLIKFNYIYAIEITNNYLNDDICYKNNIRYRLVNIGETTNYNKSLAMSRPKDEKRNAESIAPDNKCNIISMCVSNRDNKKISDRDIRNTLCALHSDIKAIDKKRVANYLQIGYHNSDIDNRISGWRTECLLIPVDYDVTDIIEEAINYCYKNALNIKPFNNKKSINYGGPKHLIKYDNFNLDILAKTDLHDLSSFTNKKLLLCGQFDPCIVFDLKYRVSDLVIWADDENYNLPLTSNIKLVHKLEEVLEMNKQFDYIIANPPYSGGNEIVHTFIDMAKKSVVLMPSSHFKANNLFNHIVSQESVDSTIFDDATIGDSLIIAEMSPDIVNDKTVEAHEIENALDIFKPFYLANSNGDKFHYAMSNFKNGGTKLTETLSPFTDFMVTVRTPQNGVHKLSKNDAADIDWNVRKVDSTIPYDKTNNIYSCSFIHFNTEQEKDNFTEFWYSNDGDNLMHKLIKGLRKTGGSIKLSLPCVDWSKKWTDADVLREYGYSDLDISNIIR